MRIPDKFKLFSQTWRIRGAVPGEIGDDLGQCRPDQLEIVLNPNQCPEQLQHTLLHELIHSIEQRQLLELTERQVDLIALGILDMFKSNPGFTDILGAADDRGE